MEGGGGEGACRPGRSVMCASADVFFFVVVIVDAKLLISANLVRFGFWFRVVLIVATNFFAGCACDLVCGA